MRFLALIVKYTVSIPLHEGCFPRQAPAALPWTGIGLCLLLLGTGCGREGVQVYSIPKEEPTPSTSTPSPNGSPPPTTNPHGGRTETVQWTLPDGWQEQSASGMRAGSFSIAGPEGQKAEVAIMPFNSMGGSDLQFVNLWRSTLGLKPVEPAQLPEMMEPIEIGADSGTLYDVVDKASGTNQENQPTMLVAKVVRGNTSWFFKLAGDADLVESQKETFQSFLKTISFKAATPTARTMAPPSTAQTGPSKPQWEIPEGWEELPPTTMLVAKFLLKGEQADTSAEVTVSVFPGDVGGLLANVNRWRNQIGLAPVEEAALSELLSSLEVDGEQAKVVDMTGKNASTGQEIRLVGTILPRGSHTWFYKLMGNASVAGQHKAAFLKFIQSARHSDA